MSIQLHLDAVAIFFTIATALYCIIRHWHKEVFYRALVIFIALNAVLQTTDWIFGSLGNKDLDFDLISSFATQTLVLALMFLLAESLHLKKVAQSILSVLITISLLTGVSIFMLSRQTLYFTVSLASLITLGTLLVASFNILRYPKTRSIDLLKLGSFWCLVAFTMLVAGAIADYSFHYLLGSRNDFLLLHDLTLAIPYVFANISFLIALRVESNVK